MKENHHLKTVQNEVADLKSKLESLKSVEAENKKLNGVVLALEKELDTMQDVLKRERDEKMDLVNEQEKHVHLRSEENEKLREENERLRKELSGASEKLKTNQQGAEENLKNRLEQEKDLLLLDQDQDRGAYQRLLKDYHELEEHAEMLERKLALHVPGHSRSLSNASSGSGQIVSTELPADDQNIVRHFYFKVASARHTSQTSAELSQLLIQNIVLSWKFPIVSDSSCTTIVINISLGCGRIQ